MYELKHVLHWLFTIEGIFYSQRSENLHAIFVSETFQRKFIGYHLWTRMDCVLKDSSEWMHACTTSLSKNVWTTVLSFYCAIGTCCFSTPHNLYPHNLYPHAYARGHHKHKGNFHGIIPGNTRFHYNRDALAFILRTSTSSPEAVHMGFIGLRQSRNITENVEVVRKWPDAKPR